jgi:hypothetical protein
MYAWTLLGFRIGGGKEATHGIFGLNEGIVDSDDLDLVMLDAGRFSQVPLVAVCGIYEQLTRYDRPVKSCQRDCPDDVGIESELTIRPMRPKPLIPTRVGMFQV